MSAEANVVRELRRDAVNLHGRKAQQISRDIRGGEKILTPTTMDWRK